MSKFVVKHIDKDAYLMFDRYVDDMNIVTTYEPVTAYQIATVFKTEEKAKEICVDAELELDDVEIIDLDIVEAEEKKAAEEKAQAAMKNAWEHTSENKRVTMVQQIIKDKNEEEADKWLDYVGETDKEKYLHPADPDIAMLENLLAGLSDEQKDKLKNMLNS